MPRPSSLVRATCAALAVAAGGPACFVDPGPPTATRDATGTDGGGGSESTGMAGGDRTGTPGGTEGRPTGRTTGEVSGTGATTGGAPDAGATGVETVVVDLVETACLAAWSSAAGPRPCPTRNIPDVAGAVAPRLDLVTEDAPDDPRVGVATAPDYQAAVGFIAGWYAPVEIPPGTRFRAVIACTAAASNCAFDWEVRVAIGAGAFDVVAAGSETYDGVATVVDVGLDPWAGPAAGIGLYVDVGEGYSSHDVAAWIEPRIVLPGG